MDIKPTTPSEERKAYPKFVGVLLALFVPGMAHFLSGKRKVGIILLTLSYFIPVIGISIATIPTMAAIYFGLLVAVVASPAFGLYVLITSWRPIKHMPSRFWVAVVASLIVLSFIKGLLNQSLPIRPYKLPTGGMQPTLMGVTTSPELESTSFFDHILYGRYDETYMANASGRFENPKSMDNGLSFNIGETKHYLPGYAIPKKPKLEYTQGDILWSGTVIMGDQMLTDRLAYLTKNPKRGDVVTFSTNGISDSRVKPDTVYVKRLVGLPGEIVSIADGNLIINGTSITEPEIFQTLKYGNDGMLSGPDQTITLGENEYLTLGDNTEKNMSLDGRFYGPILRSSIIAKVKTVYWPLDRIRVVE